VETVKKSNLMQTLSSVKKSVARTPIVHATAIIEKSVILEENVTVGPFCILTGNLTIGAGTHIHSHVTIGLPAQDRTTKKSLGSIVIGKNCHIREFVTIHASKKENGITSIGNNCYIMCYSHIAHDVVLEDNVELINNVALGGHVYIEKHTMLMAYGAIHQFCRVGQYSALSPYSGARQDLPPFCLFNGQPGKFAGLNMIALKRAGFSSQSINALKHITMLFYNHKLPLSEIKQACKKECDTWGNDALVKTFITFIEKSKRGISRKVFTYK
jgi:UDP-N-acetylglucosamine acyltransferase